MQACIGIKQSLRQGRGAYHGLASLVTNQPFEWPMEWFSPPGIPPIHCPAPSCSGET